MARRLAWIVAGALATATLAQSSIAAPETAALTQPAPERHACAIGLAVPSGIAKPDVTSDDALRRTLLSAKTIAFSGDELSGAAFRRLLADLGIARQVSAKLLDTGNGDPLELVAAGRADVGVSSPTKVASAGGVQAVIPRPTAPSPGPC